jgi:hypothetical protein
MRHNFHEARQFRRVAQLLRDLVQPSFFQRNSDDAPFLF